MIIKYEDKPCWSFAPKVSRVTKKPDFYICVVRTFSTSGLFSTSLPTNEFHATVFRN